MRQGSRKLKPFGFWMPQPVTVPYSGPPLDLNRHLELLARNNVDFVVVGGSVAGFLGRARPESNVTFRAMPPTKTVPGHHDEPPYPDPVR